ncbi:MAG: DUF3108 domain-containing protein [Chlorobi bacterium]|nr:DUF3108 domain-containing protein [Chlorobiota bacterium]
MEANRGCSINNSFPKIYFVCWFLLFVLPGYAQPGPEMPFRPGEKLTYSAYYNWNFIWLKSGQVSFSFTDSVKNSRHIWKFRAHGHTFKAYDFLYKVKDSFLSDCEAGSFAPLYFKREINHGKNHSSHSYTADAGAGKIFSEIKRRNEPFFRDTIKYRQGIYDLLAAAYYTRTLDYDNYTKGQKIGISLLVDNKISHSYFKYLGKEIVETRGSGSFRCHKISIFLLESDFFPKGEYMKIWITDDKNRIPVMAETKIFIGSVKAILESYEGLKGEMESKILTE